jgi:hypothetical protein
MHDEENFKKNYLDDYGRLVFAHSTNKNIFLHRAYYWVDLLSMLHESEEGRKHIDSYKFSTYDLFGWTLITKEQDSKVVKNYTEIYNKLKEK